MKKLPLAGLVYCTVVWGSTFIVVKDTLAFVHPVSMVAWRFAMATAAMLVLPSVRKGLRLHLRESAVLSFWLCLLFITQTAGLKYTSASNSGFITGLFVFFVPLIMMFFLKRSFGLFQWFCVALAVAGLWTLSGGAAGFNRGDALTLVAALCYAAHVILADRYVRAGLGIAVLLFHQCWMLAVSCFLLAGACGMPLAVSSAKGWWLMLFLALVPTLSGFFVQLWGQKYVPPLQTSLVFSLEPVFAAVFAWTLGGETFTAQKGIGGFMMLAAAVASEVARVRSEVLPAPARAAQGLPSGARVPDAQSSTAAPAS